MRVKKKYLIEKPKNCNPFWISQGCCQVSILVLHVNDVQLKKEVYCRQCKVHSSADVQGRVLYIYVVVFYLHGVLLPVDGVFRAWPAIFAPVHV